MRICLVTCTGDRQQSFRLCEQWMKSQTISFDEWIVVDDGSTKTTPSLATKYVNLPSDRSPRTSFGLSLLTAIERCPSEATHVFFIEDDDYYRKTYIEEMLASFKEDSYQAVGESTSLYYSIDTPAYSYRPNKSYANLCQTAVKAGTGLWLLQSTIDKYREHVSVPGQPFFDYFFWDYINKNNLFKSKLIRIGSDEVPLVIGIKGVPGRRGLGSGHSSKGNWNPDPERIRLKKLLKDDYSYYESLMHWSSSNGK